MSASPHDELLGHPLLKNLKAAGLEPAPKTSVQINIVLVFDAQRAVAARSLEGCLFATDNSMDGNGDPSQGRGTDHLSSFSIPGQVLNWIVYSVAGPISPLITKIEFADDMCTELQAYGAPAIAVSPAYIPGLTPWYYYWAGMVRPEVTPGRHAYRIDVRLGDIFLTADGLSLDVLAV